MEPDEILLNVPNGRFIQHKRNNGRYSVSLKPNEKPDPESNRGESIYVLSDSADPITVVRNFNEFGVPYALFRKKNRKDNYVLNLVNTETGDVPWWTARKPSANLSWLDFDPDTKKFHAQIIYSQDTSVSTVLHTYEFAPNERAAPRAVNSQSYIRPSGALVFHADPDAEKNTGLTFVKNRGKYSAWLDGTMIVNNSTGPISKVFQYGDLIVLRAEFKSDFRFYIYDTKLRKHMITVRNTDDTSRGAKELWFDTQAGNFTFTITYAKNWASSKNLLCQFDPQTGKYTDAYRKDMQNWHTIFFNEFDGIVQNINQRGTDMDDNKINKTYTRQSSLPQGTFNARTGYSYEILSLATAALPIEHRKNHDTNQYSASWLNHLADGDQSKSTNHILSKNPVELIYQFKDIPYVILRKTSTIEGKPLLVLVNTETGENITPNGVYDIAWCPYVNEFYAKPYNWKWYSKEDRRATKLVRHNIKSGLTDKVPVKNLSLPKGDGATLSFDCETSPGIVLGEKSKQETPLQSNSEADKLKKQLSENPLIKSFLLEMQDKFLGAIAAILTQGMETGGLSLDKLLSPEALPNQIAPAEDKSAVEEIPEPPVADSTPAETTILVKQIKKRGRKGKNASMCDFEDLGKTYIIKKTKMGESANDESAVVEKTAAQRGRIPRPLDQMNLKQLQDKLYNVRYLDKKNGTNTDTSDILARIQIEKDKINAPKNEEKARIAAEKETVKKQKLEGLSLEQLNTKLYNITYANKKDGKNRDTSAVLAQIEIEKAKIQAQNGEENPPAATDNGIPAKRPYHKNPDVQHGKKPLDYATATLEQLRRKLHHERALDNKRPIGERKGDDPELLGWIELIQAENNKSEINPAPPTAEIVPEAVPVSAPVVQEIATAPAPTPEHKPEASARLAELLQQSEPAEKNFGPNTCVIKVVSHDNKMKSVFIDGKKVLDHQLNLSHNLYFDARMVAFTYQKYAGSKGRELRIFFANGDEFKDSKGRELIKFNPAKKTVMLDDGQTRLLTGNNFSTKNKFVLDIESTPDRAEMVLLRNDLQTKDKPTPAAQPTIEAASEVIAEIIDHPNKTRSVIINGTTVAKNHEKLEYRVYLHGQVLDISSVPPAGINKQAFHMLFLTDGTRFATRNYSKITNVKLGYSGLELLLEDKTTQFLNDKNYEIQQLGNSRFKIITRVATK